MGRRIALLLTCLSVALLAALPPFTLFAEPLPPSGTYFEPGGLLPPAGLRAPQGHVAVMLELAPPAPDGTDPAGQADTAQRALLRRLTALPVQALFHTRLAFNGVAVVAPVDELPQLARLPGVARVRIIPPKQPSGQAGGPPQPSVAVASAIAGATGLGMRVGVIDRGIDYTHADFGGPGTPAAYAGNNPALLEAGSFPTAKVIDGYDFAGDAYDAEGRNGSLLPAPDRDPLECNAPLPDGTRPAYLGQGTHVAGLLAGYGVTTAGTTYYGPYTTPVAPTLMNVSPGLAPEAQLVALKVFGCHGATSLLTAAIERAIDPNGDGSPADHLDVLVISTGTPFGSSDDPDALAVDSAVRAGVVVVVAAGDQLNTFYAVNSPASARLAIAVGATNNSVAPSGQSARGPAAGAAALKPDILAPSDQIPSAAVGSGISSVALSGTAAAAAQVGAAAVMLRQLHPEWSPAQVKAALINSAAPIAGPPSLAGAGRLNLTSLSTQQILAYNADGAGGLSFGAPWLAAATLTTRTLVIENTGASDQLITLAAAATITETGVQVVAPTGALVVPAHGTARAVVGVLVDPARLDFSPDAAAAQGQGGRPRHYLAEHGGFIQVIGSRSAAETRVRPAHAANAPSVDFYLDETLLDDSLDSREVDDYINTTAGPHIVKLRREGAAPNSQPFFSAPVDLLAGHDYTLVVVGRPGALGLVVVDETIAAAPPAGQSLIHYVNANRAEANWIIGPLDVYLDGVLQVAGLGLGQSSAFTPIAPGPHEVVFRRAGSDPASRSVARKSFVVRPDTALLVGTGRHDDEDDDPGNLQQRVFIGASSIQPVAALLANVPYHIFPKAAAAARAEGALLVPPGARAFSLGLHNTGARNSSLIDMPGRPGTPLTPLASAFELTAASPPLAGLAPHLRAADLQFVGVTNSYSVTQNLDQFTYVYFGLASHAPWSTPSEVQYQVWIDANRDGRDDFVLLNSNLGELTGGQATDVFVNVLYPLRPDGSASDAFQFIFWGSYAAPIQSSIDLAPFNSAVMFQRLKASDLALPLDPANPAGPKGPTPSSFCYHVETRARALGDFSQIIDRAPAVDTAPVVGCGGRGGVLLYDIFNPAIAPINTTNFIFSVPIAPRPIFVDIQGGAVTGQVRPDIIAARGGARLLILHHHNVPAQQAEVLDVRRITVGAP